MVDTERVWTRLGALEADLRDLAAKQDTSKRAYRDDRDLQAIVERRFETAIQACLDVAAYVVASEGYREPTGYGDLFRVLEEERLLSAAVADRMVEMAASGTSSPTSTRTSTTSASTDTCRTSTTSGHSPRRSPRSSGPGTDSST